MKPPALKSQKITGLVLSGALLATQSLFAYEPEKNFWSERRRAAQRGSSTLLASLPPSGQGSASLAAQFPTPEIIRSSLTPSVVRSVPKTFLTGHADLLATLSPAHGSVRKVSLGKNAGSSGPVVIQIQDVHMNAEAQKNIRETVAVMLNSGKVGLVALEGSTEDIALQPFVNFPNRKAVELTADYLLKENKISGPIHAAMTAQGKLPRILGIDDPVHYAANVQAYKDSAPKLEETRLAIGKRRGELEEQKKAVFSPALLSLDQTVTGYRNEKVSLGDYVEILSGARESRPHSVFNLKNEGETPALPNAHSWPKIIGPPIVDTFLQALKTERTLDFKQVEAERSKLIVKLTQTLNPQEINNLMAQSLAYRTGELRYGDFYTQLKETCRIKGIRLSDYPAMDEYVRYVLLCDGIDAEQLLNEIAALEKSAYDALAKTPAEKLLAIQSRQAWLTSKLVDFSLTPPEWKEYESLLTNKDPSFASFEAFYQEAEARDTAMAKNLLEGMDLQSKFDSHPVALLVTGGFHAEGMAKQLTEKGATVISFVPKIEKVNTVQGSAYLSVFPQEKTPLEKLFQGEKLFLASSPFATHFRNILAPALVALLCVLLLGHVGGGEVDAIYSTLGGVGSLALLMVAHDTIRAQLKVKGTIIEIAVKKGSPGIQSVTESLGTELGRWSAITRFLERQFTRAERINPRQLFKELFFLGPALTQILLGWLSDPTLGPLALFLSSLTPLAITLPVFLLFHGNVFFNLLEETPKEQSKWRVAAVYFFYVAIGFVLFGLASTAMFSFALGFISDGPMWNTVPMIIASLLGSLGLAYNTHRGGNLVFPVPAMATQKEIISSLNDVFDLIDKDPQCDYDMMWDTTDQLVRVGFERGVLPEEIGGSIRTLAQKANGQYRIFINLLRVNVKDPSHLWSQNKLPAAPIAKVDFAEVNPKTQPMASSQRPMDTVRVPKVPDNVVSLNTIISECQQHDRSLDPRKTKVIEAIHGDETSDVGYVQLKSGQRIKLFRISSGGPALDSWGVAPDDRERFKSCFLLIPPPSSNERAFHREDFELFYPDGFIIRGNHHITAEKAFLMIELYLKKTDQEVKNSFNESGVLDRSHFLSIGDFSLEVFPRVDWDYTIGQYHRVDSTLIEHILEAILIDIPSLSAEQTDLNADGSEDVLLKIPLAHRIPDMNSPRQITVGDKKFHLRLGAQGLVWAINKKPVEARAEKFGSRETKKKNWRFNSSIDKALQELGILTDAGLVRQVHSDWIGLKSQLAERFHLYRTEVVKEWVQTYDSPHHWVKRGKDIWSIRIPALPLSLPAKALLKGIFKTGNSTTLGEILATGNLPHLLGMNRGKVFDSVNAIKEIAVFLQFVRTFEQHIYSRDPLFSEINDAIDLFLKTQANPNNYENLLISVRDFLTKGSRSPEFAESYVSLFIKKEADIEGGETNEVEKENPATPGNPLAKFVPMPMVGLGKRVRTFDFAPPLMTKLSSMNIQANSDLFDWSPRRDALKDELRRHPGVTEEMVQTVEDWFEKGGPDRVWVSPKHHLWDTPLSELPLSKESIQVLFRVRGMTNASTLQDLEDLGGRLEESLKGALNQEVVSVHVHAEIMEFYRVIFHLYGNLSIRQAVEGFIVGDQSVKEDDKLRKKVIELVTNSRSNRRTEDGDDRWIRLFRREILEENARFNLSRQRDRYPYLVVRDGILERLRESDWDIKKVADEFGITVSELLRSVKSNAPDLSVSDVNGFLRAHQGDVPGMARMFFRANQDFEFFDVLRGLKINAPILRDCVVARLKASGTVAQAATDWGVEIPWMRRLVEVIGVESFPPFADMQEYLALHDGNVAEAQRFFFGGENRAEADFFRYIEKREDFKTGLRDYVLNNLRKLGTKQRMATDWKVGTQWVRTMMELTGIEEFPIGEDYRQYLEANDLNLEACKKFYSPSGSFQVFVDKLIAAQGVSQFLNEKIRELSGASSGRNDLAERLGIGVPSLSYLLNRLDLTELIPNSVKKSPAQDLFEEFKDAVEVCGNDTQSLLDLFLVLKGEAIPLAQVKKYVRDFTELHLGEVARRGAGGLGNRERRMLEFFFRKASLINKINADERRMLVAVFLKVLFIELSDEKVGPALMAQLDAARSKGIFFEELYQAAYELTESALRYRAPHIHTRLLPHQRVGAFFLNHHARAYLGDGTGLGKTIEALAAMDPHWKVFVAAPASMLDSWQKEIYKHFTPEALRGTKILVLSGDQEKRQHLMDSVRDEKGVIVIGSIQSLRGKSSQDLEGLCHGLDLFVVDESQMGANFRGEGDQRNAQQAEALQKIMSPRKWYLSATAYGSNHQQLFAMLHALSRGTPEDGKYRDYKEFCQIHPRNDPLGYRLLRSAMRAVSMSREPDDVMKRFDPPTVQSLADQGARLPHLHDLPYTATGGYFLNEEQIDMLLRLVKDFGRFAAWYNERVPESQRLTEDQINPFTKLRFAFDLMINPARVGGKSVSPLWGELDRVVDFYVSSGKKGILFTFNTSVLEVALNRYAHYGVARIDGSITGYAHDPKGNVIKGYFDRSGELVVDATDPRARPVDAKTYQRHLFQTDPNVRIIVVNMKAGGVGLDLTAAEYAVQVQLPDTYTLDRQLDGRMVRVDLRRPHESVDKIRMVARFPAGWADRYKGTEFESLAEELSASGTPAEIQLERNKAGERVFRLVMTDLATPEEQDTLDGRSIRSFFPGFQQDKSMERYYASLRSLSVRKTLELFLPLYEKAQSEEQIGQVLELAELYFKTGQIKGLEDLVRSLGAADEDNVGFLSSLQRIPNKFARARWMERITLFLGELYSVGKGESIATEMEEFSFLFEEAPYVVLPLYAVLGQSNAKVEREILASLLSEIDRTMGPKNKSLFYQSLCLWLLHVDGSETQARFFSLLKKYQGLFVGPGTDLSWKTDRFEKMLRLVEYPETEEFLLTRETPDDPESFDEGLLRVTERVAQRTFNLSPADSISLCRSFPALLTAFQMAKVLNGNPKFEKEAIQLQEVMSQVASDRYDAWRNRQEGDRLRGNKLDFLESEEDFWKIFTKEESVSINGFEIGLAEHQAHLEKVIGQIQGLMTQEDNAAIGETVGEWAPKEFLALTTMETPDKVLSGQRAELAAVLSRVRSAQGRLSASDQSVLARYGIFTEGNVTEAATKIQERLRAYSTLEDWLILSQWLSRLTASPPSPAQLRNLRLVVSKIIGRATSLGASKIAEHLELFLQTLNQLNEHSRFERLTVEFTTNPSTILERGMLHPRLVDCFNAYANPEQFSTLVDDLGSRNKILALVRDQNGQILARSVVKVKRLADGTPVLFPERPLYLGNHDFENEILEALRRTKAEKLARFHAQLARESSLAKGGQKIFDTGGYGTREYFEPLFGVRSREKGAVYHHGVIVPGTVVHVPFLGGIGYQGQSIESFMRLLKENGITLVIDVRENAYSHRPDFSQTLEPRLEREGIQYEHWKSLGAPKPLREGHRYGENDREFQEKYAQHLEAHRHVVDDLLPHLKGQRVALLCYERDPSQCHRTGILNALEGRIHSDEPIGNLRSPGASQMDLFGNPGDGKATSKWGLRFAEWLGSKVDPENGRENFGAAYKRFAAIIEWSVSAKVAFWAFLVTLAFSSGPLGWAIAPAMGAVYGILFVASHYIPKSMAPVTKVKVGVVQTWTMGVIYGVLIGATPFLLGAVPLLGVPEFGVQAGGLLWALAGLLHHSFDKKNLREEGEQAARELVTEISGLTGAFESVMPGVQMEHTEQIVGKESSSPDFMTETLSRLKTDKEFRAGFLGVVQMAIAEENLSGTSLNLLSAMVVAATGQPMAYVHLLGNSPVQELQTLERLIERPEGKTASGFTVALVVSQSQRIEFKTMIDAFESRGVAVFSVDLHAQGWTQEALVRLDSEMSPFLAKANGVVATVGGKVGIRLNHVTALSQDSKLRTALMNALTLTEVVETFLRVLRQVASNA